MSEDARCCGSGTCIIDAQGRCWCGQQWDGEKLGAAAPPPALPSTGDAVPERADTTPRSAP